MDKKRINAILALGLPIIGGMLSQNLLNLIDTAMVGRLGSISLAAVGTASFINFMCIAFVTGLSAGVQAVAARRYGEGRYSEMAVPLNGALLFAILFSLPLTVILYLGAPGIFNLVNNTPEVASAGTPYLQARILAMVAVGMNFSFRGYWNGINMPKMYLQTLVIMHITNVVLNWVFIFGNLGVPAMGTLGAGIASAIATFVGTAYYLYLGWRHARGHGFLHGIPSRESFSNILQLAIPNGLQQLFFAAGFTTLFWILGKVGTETAAAANVLINIMLVAILPGIALGMAAASLVGQALGRGDTADAKNWGWDVVKVAMLLLTLLGLPMWAFPDTILKIFIQEIPTIELARIPLILIGLTIWLDGMGLVLLHSLLGAGASRRVMLISIALQWGVFLPAAYVTGPILGYGLLGIWIMQVIYRGLQAATFAHQWKQGNWTQIRV